jgi:hypothetical protein
MSICACASVTAAWLLEVVLCSGRPQPGEQLRTEQRFYLSTCLNAAHCAVPASSNLREVTLLAARCTFTGPTETTR